MRCATYGNKSTVNQVDQDTIIKNGQTKWKALGLIPSDTKLPNGKKTGQQMSHYIEKEGLFERKFQVMPKEYILPFTSIESTFEQIMKGRSNSQGDKEPLPPKKKNKVKYTCPSCSMNVWGKPDLNINCGECDQRLESILDKYARPLRGQSTKEKEFEIGE